MEDRATLRSDPSAIPGLEKGVVPSRATLFYMVQPKYHSLWKLNAINLGGAGAGPRRYPLSLIRNISPKIGTFELQPMSFFQQSAANGLGKAFHFKERIPVFRAALSAHNDGMTAKLRLIEEFLHQELVFRRDRARSLLR